MQRRDLQGRERPLAKGFSQSSGRGDRRGFWNVSPGLAVVQWAISPQVMSLMQEGPAAMAFDFFLPPGSSDLEASFLVFAWGLFVFAAK